MIDRAMARPSPLPPASSERASSRRMNGSKMRSSSSAGIGGPSLATTRLTTLASCRQRHRDLRRRVTFGVVEQVAHHAHDGVGVGGDLAPVASAVT